MVQPASRDAAESSAEIPPPRESGRRTLLAAFERPSPETHELRVARHEDDVVADGPPAGSSEAIARAPQSSVRRRRPPAKKSKRPKR